MAPKQQPDTGGVADDNGRLVEQFSTTMHNLGLNRAADELVDMLQSGRWQRWSQGGREFVFLPGEYDYFLTQQSIQREDVMVIPDVEAKARLEEAMDERRTGEDGYRRRIAVARTELPDIPGRLPTPFGYSRSEAESVPDLAEQSAGRGRPALGSSVRRFANTGGAPPPRDERPRWERLAASVTRLEDDDLERVKAEIEAEMERRRSGTAR